MESENLNLQINNFDLINTNLNSSSDENLEITYRNIMLNDYSSSEEDYVDVEDSNFTTKLNEAFDFMNFYIVKENKHVKNYKTQVKRQKASVSKEFDKLITDYKFEINQFHINDNLIKQSLLFKSKDIINFCFKENKNLAVSMKLVNQYQDSKLCKSLKRVMHSNNTEGDKTNDFLAKSVSTNRDRDREMETEKEKFKKNYEKRERENLDEIAKEKLNKFERLKKSMYSVASNGVNLIKNDLQLNANNKPNSKQIVTQLRLDNNLKNPNKEYHEPYNVNNLTSSKENRYLNERRDSKNNLEKMNKIVKVVNNNQIKSNNIPNSDSNSNNIFQYTNKFHNSLLYKDGIIYCSRDFKAFHYMISFFRSEIIQFDSIQDEQLLLDELKYWEIVQSNESKRLKLNIKNSLVFLPNKFDRDWCASTLIYSEENYIEKQDGQHGIVFLKNPLHEINEYVEFLVKIKIASHCSSHIFIGVLDKTKYKKEYLSKLK